MFSPWFPDVVSGISLLGVSYKSNHAEGDKQHGCTEWWRVQWDFFLNCIGAWLIYTTIRDMFKEHTTWSCRVNIISLRLNSYRNFPMRMLTGDPWIWPLRDYGLEPTRDTSRYTAMAMSIFLQASHASLAVCVAPSAWAASRSPWMDWCKASGIRSFPTSERPSVDIADIPLPEAPFTSSAKRILPISSSIVGTAYPPAPTPPTPGPPAGAAGAIGGGMATAGSAGGLGRGVVFMHGTSEDQKWKSPCAKARRGALFCRIRPAFRWITSYT